ncbi:hypothetical protein CIK67_17770 [Brachybacterium alimentarium]|nr:hypothetical protein CIK67_17770 [Brachybacterium alimentarium]
MLTGVRVNLISCTVTKAYAQNCVACVSRSGDLSGFLVERFQVLAEKSFEFISEVEQSHFDFSQ